MYRLKHTYAIALQILNLGAKVTVACGGVNAACLQLGTCNSDCGGTADRGRSNCYGGRLSNNVSLELVQEKPRYSLGSRYIVIAQRALDLVLSLYPRN